MFPLFTPPCRHTAPRPKCVRCRHNCRVRDGLCNRCFAFEHGLPVVTDARSIVNYEALRRADELRDTADIGPCMAVPGSVEKLAVLMARADCGVPLFDDGDREPGEERKAARTVFDELSDEDFEE